MWNPDRPARADRQFVDYFPGHEYVDVLALDCYAAFEQQYYDDLCALSNGKVLGISETHNPPSSDIYSSQSQWAFYMTWAIDVPSERRPIPPDRPALRALVRDPRMLSLEDPAHWEGINPVRVACGLEPTTSLPTLP